MRVNNSGDSIQLHCASFLRILFAWLARARSELGRFSLKTEFFSEINGRFLLIEHGDPHFLLYITQDSVPG